VVAPCGVVFETVGDDDAALLGQLQDCLDRLCSLHTMTPTMAGSVPSCGAQ
jgi:hypothetical protein